MSLLVTLNGQNYIIPEPNEVGWGANLDSYFVAIAAGVLQKTGGNFTLSAETDFGSSFGLKSLYYKTRSSNVSSTGAFRLANAETGIGWRNALGNGDLLLTVNASNELTFNGIPISGPGSYTANRAIVSDSSGFLTVSSTTDTEIGYVHGVTSSIQTQINSRVPKVNVSFNVKDYGAVGNGTTDDTAAIQAAINATQSSYFGELVFPVGTYKITSQLNITHSMAIRGLGISVDEVHNYTTDAGTPNVHTGGVAIYQATTNTNGIFVQQSGTYRVVLYIDNISVWGPGTGISGDGITISSTDANENIECHFNRVRINYFQGYGLNLVEGYYSSSFQDMYCIGSGLAGFRAVGTSQGEFTVDNLRCFGNGALGVTEADQAGLYCASGGTRISFNGVSCTSNQTVQAYFRSCQFTLTDFQAESFLLHNSSSRCLILDSCSPVIEGVYLSPQSLFLGKMIDARSMTYGWLSGLEFFTEADPSGYNIFEDGGCAGNTYSYSTFSVAFRESLSATSWNFRSAEGISFIGRDETISGTKTYSSHITITPTTNQLVLGTTRTYTITAPTPATSSRTLTIPDPGANASFVLTEGSRTINGATTFGSTVTITYGNPVVNTLATSTSGNSAFYAQNSDTNGLLLGSLGKTTAGLWNGHAVSASLGLSLITSDNSIVMYPGASGLFLSLGYFNGSTGVESLLINSSGVSTGTGVPLIFKDTEGTPKTVTMSVPATLSASYNFILPTNHGGANQYLTDDGTGTLSWTNAAGTGTVDSGTAGRLSLYNTSTNAITDTYVQNTKNITIAIATQGTRSANLALTIPNPGDAVTSANLLLSEGAQTINGAQTFTSSVYLPAATNNGFAYFANSGPGGQLTSTAAAADGELLIGHSSNPPSKSTLTGTSNQVIVTNGAGSITLSLPQSIATSSSPTFATGTFTQVEVTGSSASDIIGRVTNTNSGSSARALLSIVAGPSGAGGGDAVLEFTSASSATISFITGIDQSDSQKWKVSRGAALGTNDNIIIANGADGVAIHGSVTNDSAAAGYVGEYIESVVGLTNFPTSGTWGDLTSITLTAGDWDVVALGQMTTPHTQTGEFRIGISTTTGNNATGLVIGSNRLTFLPATASTDASATIPPYRLSLSGSTVVYFKMWDEYSGGTPQLTGRLSARRVR